MALLPKSKLATRSLTLGLVGWAIYLLQWCFDLTLGILLAAVTAGTSTVCATIMDVVPFALWLVGIVIGHIALNQIKKRGGPGLGKVIWGLAVNYFGLLFLVLSTIGFIIMIATGIGVGLFDKILPLIRK